MHFRHGRYPRASACVNVISSSAPEHPYFMWYFLPVAEATHTRTIGGAFGGVLGAVVVLVVMVVVGGALGGGLGGGASMWMSSLDALALTLMLTFTVFTFSALTFTLMPPGSRTRLRQHNMSAWGFCALPAGNYAIGSARPEWL